MMFVPKVDRLRHKVLAILYERYKQAEGVDNDVINVERFCVKTEVLAERLKITTSKLHEVMSCVQAYEDIKYDNFGEGEVIFLWKNGATDFIDRKYIRSGRKRMNEEVYDFTKWLLPLVLAFITIYTTVTVSKESKENKRQLGMLQSKVDSIKANPTMIIQPIIRLDSLSIKSR